eukprot:2879971-Prymnesium_polylepis.1
MHAQKGSILSLWLHCHPGTLVHEVDDDANAEDAGGGFFKLRHAMARAGGSLDMLVVTQSYCCFSIRSAVTVDVKVLWSEVKEISAPQLNDNLNLNDIIWEFKDGEKYTFYPDTTQYKRAEVFATLEAILQRATRNLDKTGAQFVPRQLTFIAPLQILSLLPFELNAELEQVPPTFLDSSTRSSKIPIPPPPSDARPKEMQLSPSVRHK